MKVLSTRFRLLSMAIVFSVLLLTPSIAFAHGDGSDDVSDDSNRNGDSSQITSTNSKPSDDSNENGDDNSTHTSVKDRVNELLSERREHKTRKHSAEVIKRTCENRQAMINKKITSFGIVADRHLTRFDKIFTNLKEYRETNQVDVANYDTLVADATAKQASATEAVNALKAVSVTIDCSAQDPASAIASVQTAASDARTALQNYRKSLKTLAHALIDAKDTTGGTDDGGDQ